jgi:hypothetical protein
MLQTLEQLASLNISFGGQIMVFPINNAGVQAHLYGEINEKIRA